ncbi:MAG: HhH-GPD-type base excision DNA repair protein [Acidimicrobiales bacterium]|nr:HhH-GPD-type base excision DNA repair protein [Acidimicrobiales bacterium]
MKPGTLWITADPEVDALVNTDPLALLIGMLLDQQVAIELAFRGPHRLQERMGVLLDAATIAAWDCDAFTKLCCEKPAIHRFPAVMAGRIQELCSHVADEYVGRPERIWQRCHSAETVTTNLRAIPGYGDEKARIFLAILAKRFGIRPDGWEAAAAPFSDELPRSVADMGSAEGRLAVREWKKAQKAAGKTKSD